MTSNYTVGYGRPPKASQFKKGQSGNQAGSSRKVRKRKRRLNLSIDEVVLENSEKPLRLREGNRTSSVSTKEALLKKQIAMGLNGNRLALKASLDRIDRAEQKKLEQMLELYELALDMKESYSARAQFNRSRGLPPPLPHPDDVHLNRYTGEVRFTGPLNLLDLASLTKILEVQEFFKNELAGIRSDMEECAREGVPYSASDMEIIFTLEKYLARLDDELEKRGWLPRVAGKKATSGETQQSS